MTLTIELAPELESRLRDEAARNGMGVDAFVSRAVEQQLRQAAVDPPRLAAEEARLLLQINDGMSAGELERYRELGAKRRGESLSPDEQRELVGMSFDSNEKLYLQSRGHFLTGGPREMQFTLFKQWAITHARLFSIALGDQYVAYGEWLYSKHTVFYDLLRHYWMEFDILDKRRSTPQDPWFLDTPSRAALLQGLPYVPVKVLWSGKWTRDLQFEDLVRPSHFKSPHWRERLRGQVDKLGYSWDLIWKHTDHSDLMEGVYIKWEDEGRVLGRYKFVRRDFVSLIVDNVEHHMDLPLTPNVLADGVDLYTS